jgi:hypothetical protein
MPLPAPEPGLVISHAYLWRHEHEAGQEEGQKHRPCVIVLCTERQDQTTLVTVAPITHGAPQGVTIGMGLPPRVKQHLGLDSDRSWIILSEVNQFVWPGFDLRPIPGSTDKFDYGFLPPKLFEQIKSAMLELILQRRARITSRD